MTSAGGREREENWGRSSHEEAGRHGFNLGINQESSYDQNPSPSSSSLINGCSNPFNSSFVRWDPSSLTLSHPPPPPPRGSPNCPSSPPHQGGDWHNFSLLPMQPHQLLVYQPTQTDFQSQIAGFQGPDEPSTRPVHFNLLPSQNNHGS